MIERRSSIFYSGILDIYNNLKVKMVHHPGGRGKRVKAGNIKRCKKERGVDCNTARRNESVWSHLEKIALKVGESCFWYQCVRVLYLHAVSRVKKNMLVILVFFRGSPLWSPRLSGILKMPSGTPACPRAFSRSPPGSGDQSGDPLKKTRITYTDSRKFKGKPFMSVKTNENKRKSFKN